MAKPEWGTKRICLSCGARFYDLNRDPIVCPACGAPYDPMAQSRPRRTRAAAAPKAAAVAAAEAETKQQADEVETEDEDVELEPEGEQAESSGQDEEQEDNEEEDSDAAIEDVSELGDDEDMSDVIDTEVDDEEGER